MELFNANVNMRVRILFSASLGPESKLAIEFQMTRVLPHVRPSRLSKPILARFRFSKGTNRGSRTRINSLSRTRFELFFIMYQRWFRFLFWFIIIPKIPAAGHQYLQYKIRPPLLFASNSVNKRKFERPFCQIRFVV